MVVAKIFHRYFLHGQINDVLVDQISNQFGIKDRNQAESAVEGGFTTLLNAIAKNVASPSGAEGLSGALDRDHDGSIMDDIAGFLGGTRQANNTSMLNGSGILKHLLGGQQNQVVEMLGKATGLHESQAGQMLMSLAPVVMGMLGRLLSFTQSLNYLNHTSNKLSKVIICLQNWS